jgi:hypothetical protein
MKAIIVIALALAACGHRGTKRSTLDPTAGKKLEIQVLLDERLARSSNMEALGTQLTVTPKRLAVIGDRARMYVVGWGGTTPIQGMGRFDAFEYTNDGLLVLVHETTLLYMDSDGKLQTLTTLPHTGMGLARSDNALLLFDRTRSDSHAAIYELEPGRQARKLVESPTPIDAVARTGNRLFFATGGVAFEATAGERLVPVASLPGKTMIRSIAATADRLYVSDGDSIYVVRGTESALVTKGLGGTLRMDRDALLVLDHKRRMLARITGLP